MAKPRKERPTKKKLMKGEPPDKGSQGTPRVNADGTGRLHEDEALSKDMLTVMQIGEQPEPDLPALVAALSFADPKARHLAMLHIGKAGPAAIPLLQVALNTDNEYWRCVVITALSMVENGSARTVPILVEQLAHPNSVVRETAIDALYSLGTLAKRAAPALMRLIDDPAWYVRRKAIGALGVIGARTKSLLNEMRRKLSCDDDKEMLWAVISTVGAFGPDGAAALPELTKVYERAVDDGGYPDDDDLRICVCRAWRKIGKAAVPDIVTQLRIASNPDMVRWLTDTLVQIGPDAAQSIPDLVVLQRNENWEVQIYAASALGRLGARTNQYLPLLLDSLKDEDASVRTAAAYALCQIGPPAAKCVPELTKALTDEHSNVRAHAAQALGSMGAKATRTLPDLLRACGDESSWVRGYAAETIGRIGPGAEAAVPTLIPMLNDADRFVSGAAETALCRVKAQIQDTIAALSRFLSDPDYNRVAATAYELAELGPLAKNIVPELTNLLDHREMWVRCASARALAKIGHPNEETILRLAAHLDDSDSSLVRRTGAEALNSLAKEYAVTRTALRALKSATNDIHPDVRNAARAAIKTIRSAASTSE